MKKYQISIDGPASSGKSTMAKILADKLNFTYFDTGAMYRAVAFYLIENDISIKNDNEIKNALDHIEINFKNTESGQQVYLNNEDVSEAIRQKEVTNLVSVVAAKDYVRDFLVHEQRKMAQNESVVMDGRDIGSVVLPEADVKFFLVASVEERARRRYKENQEKGRSNESLEEIKKSIEERDYYDSNRKNSPLTKTPDMIEIDTSSLSIEEVTEKMLSIIKNKINQKK